MRPGNLVTHPRYHHTRDIVLTRDIILTSLVFQAFFVLSDPANLCDQKFSPKMLQPQTQPKPKPAAWQLSMIANVKKIQN